MSSACTVKISNISLSASERDIQEFFSFSGDIKYVQMQSESEMSQIAYVTFKDSQGADTAILLSGATIVDMRVTVTAAENYLLPSEALKTTNVDGQGSLVNSTVSNTEDVMSTMLAKGLFLGKDALNKVKAIDERFRLTSNATATLTSLDRKIGLRDKISIGAYVMNEKAREVDDRFQVSEITKSTFATAEKKATTAGSVFMSNPYVFTGATWVSNAFSKAAKVAEDVTLMTKEKIDRAEEERMEKLLMEKTGMVYQFAEDHFDDSSLPDEAAIVPINSLDEVKKLGIM
ncbi:RNA recognition motif containing protein [Zostera marina]|uniref:RNA recognition motif containing protein n=1 Tax=Zostera marina TaxID=29655 RepID=A0A0K9PS97_ZOSMR|nr:RNA recognition motif containing protein [Zostera marina]